MCSFLQRQLNHNIDPLICEINPLIIAFNETRHKFTNEIEISNFKTYEKPGEDTNGRIKGGVALLIRQNFPHTEIKLNTNMQAVAVEVNAPFKHTIINMYIPPMENFDENEIKK
jgi:hypothetical protein